MYDVFGQLLIIITSTQLVKEIVFLCCRTLPNVAVFLAQGRPNFTMSVPTVLLNNLVKVEDSTYIDPISKAYLIGDSLLGINRLMLFRRIKPYFILLCSGYGLFLCGIAFYWIYCSDTAAFYSIGIKFQCVDYLLSMILNILIWQRLKHYYQKLQEFDMMIGCRPKRTAAAIRNLIQACVAVIFIMLLIPYEYFMFDGEAIPQHVVYMPLRLLQVIDVHFYGHLLSLLVPRLRLINYYMNISLSDQKTIAAPNVDELTIKSVTLESHNGEMRKLMDLYSLVISAYDMLIDAIKWQFAMALTCIFVSLLAFSYTAALVLIRGTRPFLRVAVEFAFIGVRTLPLFAPCIFADQIQEEVCRLRELVASRLYENKLTKPGRIAARALLALTEVRDLSFSLLQMIGINISLPFKFMGLFLTYLIILLQFEKVINP